jgi:hypothetical protein
MSPVRAQSAVASKPPRAASAPASPYAVTDAKPRARVERGVGDEHVRALDESAQDGAALGLAQIEREPTLAAVVDDPAVVVRALGHAGAAGAVSVEIAVGRLDLDDVGPEIGEDRRRHRARDEARGVDDAQAVTQAPLGHGSVLTIHSEKSRRKARNPGRCSAGKP